MAPSAHEIQEKQAILHAAGVIFDEVGFDRGTVEAIAAQAGVSKADVWDHYASKEELALAVIAAQPKEVAPAPCDVNLQLLVDSGQVLAYQLRTDPMQRAASRLAMEQSSQRLDRRKSWDEWTEVVASLLRAAEANGELRPGVEIGDFAALCAGCFAGLQAMSQAYSGRMDLTQRVSTMWRHLLAGVATPETYGRLDLSPDRGESIVTRHRES